MANYSNSLILFILFGLSFGLSAMVIEAPKKRTTVLEKIAEKSYFIRAADPKAKYKYGRYFEIPVHAFLCTMGYVCDMGDVEMDLYHSRNRDDSEPLGGLFKTFDRPMLDALKSLFKHYKVAEFMKSGKDQLAELLIIDLCHWVQTHKTLVSNPQTTSRMTASTQLVQFFEEKRGAQLRLTVKNEAGEYLYKDMALFCTVAPELIQHFRFLEKTGNFKESNQNEFLLGIEYDLSSLIFFKKILYFIYHAKLIADLTFANKPDDFRKDMHALLTQFMRETFISGEIAVSEILDLAHRWNVDNLIDAIMGAVQEEGDPQAVECLAQQIPLEFFPSLVKNRETMGFATRLLNERIRMMVLKKTIEQFETSTKNEINPSECIKTLADNILSLPLESLQLEPWLEVALCEKVTEKHKFAPGKRLSELVNLIIEKASIDFRNGRDAAEKLINTWRADTTRLEKLDKHHHWIIKLDSNFAQLFVNLKNCLSDPESRNAHLRSIHDYFEGFISKLRSCGIDKIIADKKLDAINAQAQKMILSVSLEIATIIFNAKDFDEVLNALANCRRRNVLATFTGENIPLAGDMVPAA